MALDKPYEAVSQIPSLSPTSCKMVIEGGHRLSGEVSISGAKNAALPLLAATLLTDEECVIENVPNIDDIHTMVALLRNLGATVKVEERRHRITVRANTVHNLRPEPSLIDRMRASFLVVGPLLARFGEFCCPPPGGCSLGLRPVDFDIRGFQRMGAEVKRREGLYVAKAHRLKGVRIFMDYPSHTGTENLMMAACLTEGTTLIRNASPEPEAINLGECLRSMGAKIYGLGSSTVCVEGAERLHGVRRRVIPDRMEAGTFAIAAAMAGGEVLLRDVDCEHMDALIYKLREIGLEVQEGKGTLYVRGRGPLSAVEIQTFPYPGFPTDLQPAMSTLLTQAEGISPVYERVHRNRFLYVDHLVKMGAKIQVSGVSATIEGPTRLKGKRVRALDVRSGGALIVAGLAAEGITEVEDIFYVDRGHERIDEKLTGLGAKMKRIGEGI